MVSSKQMIMGLVLSGSLASAMMSEVSPEGSEIQPQLPTARPLFPDSPVRSLPSASVGPLDSTPLRPSRNASASVDSAQKLDLSYITPATKRPGYEEFLSSTHADDRRRAAQLDEDDKGDDDKGDALTKKTGEDAAQGPIDGAVASTDAAAKGSLKEDALSNVSKSQNLNQISFQSRMRKFQNSHRTMFPDRDIRNHSAILLRVSRKRYENYSMRALRGQNQVLKINAKSVRADKIEKYKQVIVTSLVGPSFHRNSRPWFTLTIKTGQDAIKKNNKGWSVKVEPGGDDLADKIVETYANYVRAYSKSHGNGTRNNKRRSVSDQEDSLLCQSSEMGVKRCFSDDDDGQRVYKIDGKVVFSVSAPKKSEEEAVAAKKYSVFENGKFTVAEKPEVSPSAVVVMDGTGGLMKPIAEKKTDGAEEEKKATPEVSKVVPEDREVALEEHREIASVPRPPSADARPEGEEMEEEKGQKMDDTAAKKTTGEADVEEKPFEDDSKTKVASVEEADEAVSPVAVEKPASGFLAPPVPTDVPAVV